MVNNSGASHLPGKRSSFVFVADYNKTVPDIAMLVSKFSFDSFDRGSRWAKGWNDVVKTVQRVCDKEKSKVSFLRLSCHGNENGFALGYSIFVVKNHKLWKPAVEKITKYFVPGVSFVTIDYCKKGQNTEFLTLFPKAPGGVEVRGY